MLLLGVAGSAVSGVVVEKGQRQREQQPSPLTLLVSGGSVRSCHASPPWCWQEAMAKQSTLCLLLPLILCCCLGWQAVRQCGLAVATAMALVGGRPSCLDQGVALIVRLVSPPTRSFPPDPGVRGERVQDNLTGVQDQRHCWWQQGNYSNVLDQ